MAVQPITGIVKQVVSGDNIIIRDIPKDTKPHEKTVILAGINAPKLGKKKKDGIDKDEPYAWEAREFLRKKLIGQTVSIVVKPLTEKPGQEKPIVNSSSDRIYGKVFLKDSKTDIAEELVANGLAKVKSKADKNKTTDLELKKLLELQEEATNQKKGLWKKDNDKHIRNVVYVSDRWDSIVADYGKKNLSAIIEQVRNGPFMLILDVLILPNFISIPVSISGLKVEDEEYKDEAKFFVETRLLQQDNVVIIIEKARKNCVAGSIIHPKGNIAELLLQEGLAACDDFTMSTVTGGAPKLRQAEKSAKDKRLRIWKNRPIVPASKKEEYQAIVSEIINGEVLMVKQVHTGEIKKIFLASIKSPKAESKDRRDQEDKTRTSRPIFDVPWLFEARELLRTKLIGKKVNVLVDYVQPKKDDYPEKTCCTVTIGGLNIAEALVANGLATVINHRQDDDNRSSQYDALQAAELKAKENGKGKYSKESPPKHRVTECLGNRAQGLLPMLQKASRIEGIVEHVMSGSKVRLYIPKDSLMITLLLSGISCPRAGSSGGKTGRPVPSDPYGDDALNFTKERILQRQVEIRIENLDKFGNMIGSLFYNNTNWALALVEEGLASVHHTCSDRNLVQAQNAAKAKKLNLWQNAEEEKKDTNEDDVAERTFNYKEAIVTAVAPDLHIYAQHIDQKQAFNKVTDTLKAEAGSYPRCSKESPPSKGKLYAAKYSDNEWYRGKIEKVFASSGKAYVNYVDYGNRENVLFQDLAILPDYVSSPKPFAHEYGLACVQLPPEYYKMDIVQYLIQELADRKLRINVEYAEQNLSYVSIVDPETEEDCIKACIAKGMFYVQKRREKKFQALIDEYLKAQTEAKKERLLIWEYGDAREDDAKEFGLGK